MGLAYNLQVPTAIKEYSMTPVTEGIDAIATTRVVITRDVSNTTKHALADHSFVRHYRLQSFKYNFICFEATISQMVCYLWHMLFFLFSFNLSLCLLTSVGAGQTWTLWHLVSELTLMP